METLGEPVSPGSHQRERVVIPSGAGTVGVGRLLARRDLIRSAPYFDAMAFFSGASTRLEAGTYLLGPGMHPSGIIGRLVAGDTATVRVTVIPGSTVTEVAASLARARLFPARAFLAYAAVAKPPPGYADPSGVRDPLEGFLYPDTYRIPLGSTPAQVAAMMEAAFEAAVPPADQKLAAREGLSPLEALTLASIVEREARFASERATIAGVFMNRLKDHMPLQSDATVMYAARVPPGGPLTAKDLQVKSPYNTYRVRGLPPGPIANPSGASIVAALHPARVPYLFFYGLPDGRHVFSRTYAGQLRAEARYGAPPAHGKSGPAGFATKRKGVRGGKP